MTNTCAPAVTLLIRFCLLTTRKAFPGVLPGPGLLLLCLCLLPALAFAQAASHIPVETLQYLEDPDAKLTLENLEGWQEENTSTFNRGYSKSTWWLKFELTNPYPQTEWVLEVAYPVLDQLEVNFVSRNSKLLEHYTLGDKIPFYQRPVQHRNFLVPFSLKQNESMDVVIRVRSSSALQVPVKVWAPTAFHAQDTRVNFIEGAFFGGLLVIAIYNFFMYFVIRSRVYLFYLGNNLSLFLFFFSLHGWSFQFFWPRATQWNDTAIVSSLALTLYFAWNFVGSFLETKMISPTFARMQDISVGIATLLIVLAFLLPYSIAITSIIVFACYSCVGGYICGYAAWRKGHAYARIFILAWSIFLLGSIILAASKFNLLPKNLFTEYAIQFGALMEVLLFSLALADRINNERAMRIRAQQHALSIQRKANEELEFRVEQRTSELADANMRLKTLSDTDQLTGLKNRRFLDEFLIEEFKKAIQAKRNIAIMLIDVDHFKEVNDTHGHLVGDECLQALAERIRQSLRRPSDVIARYGGEEFCVVITDFSEIGIEAIAESIRKNIEQSVINTSETTLSMTVSIGATQGIPESEDSMLAFMALADKALYEAKSSGRNCVRYFAHTKSS